MSQSRTTRAFILALAMSAFVGTASAQNPPDNVDIDNFDSAPETAAPMPTVTPTVTPTPESTPVATTQTAPAAQTTPTPAPTAPTSSTPAPVSTAPALSMPTTSVAPAPTPAIVPNIADVYGGYPPPMRLPRPIKPKPNDDQYTRPLYFAPEENGVILPPLELQYDLSKGDELKLGPLRFDENSFAINLIPLATFDPRLPEALGLSDKTTVLAVRWPEGVVKEGVLEIISRTGETLWSMRISESRKKQWMNRLDSWSNLLGETKSRRLTSRSPLWKSQFGILDVQKQEGTFNNIHTTFRFCMSQNAEKFRNTMCSQRFSITRQGGEISFARIEDPTPPRVLIQNEHAPLAQIVKIKDPTQPVQFFAELANGTTLEFTTLAGPLNIVDMVIAEPHVIRVTGFGKKPIGNLIELNPDNPNSFSSRIGWQQTIGEIRKYWSVNLQSDRLYVYLPGDTGGFFRQRFETKALPSDRVRPWLEKHTPTSVYTDGTALRGEAAENTAVDSEQYEVEVPDEDSPLEFRWKFQAEERGALNRSYVQVKDKNNRKWKAFYELHKGYPMELSGRLTGVVSSQLKMIFLGEVTFNAWPQNILGWNNHWLSRQRWGFNTRYFQSFNPISLGQNSKGEDVVVKKISVFNTDVKYRFSPGVWGRDETWGLIGSYQRVAFDDLTSPQMGGGLFWARSMPQVFDNLFNFFPFMRYPKFVDMEFIYYAMSLNKDVALNGNMALNFHGKLFWSERIFGEAGFGVKQYSYLDYSQNKKVALTSIYGTMGLGVNF